jgi:hypothetical protein
MRNLFASSFALSALLLVTSGAAALKSNPKSSSCMSRSEAKAAHKGAYLYWHRNAEGQRCWSTRRVKAPHHARRAAPPFKGEKVITDEDTPAPKLLPVIPYQLLFPPVPGAPLPIPPEATRAQSISDWSPWIWTNEAYASAPGPQVTPTPPEPTPVNREAKSDRQSGRSNITVDAIMALLAFWLIIIMVGGTLYRWVRQRDALRIR